MKYDAVFVGAGLTAATICAVMKKTWKILVLDTRNHLGGICQDYKQGDNYFQFHGPHNWHCPPQDMTKMNFLSRFTEWSDFEYTVTGEINQNGYIKRVPFPYSQETEKETGRLNEEEIINLFFREYSEKMWGMSYDELPNSIKGRVSKNTALKSCYFPGHVQAQPKLGYTHMIENMFDGVEIILNVDPIMWKEIPTYRVFYSGRPDMLVDGPKLSWRTLNIEWKHEDWDADTVTVNFQHKTTKYTRKINHGMYYHKKGTTISYETPVQATDDDLMPYYPIPTDENIHNYYQIKEKVAQKYPNLRLIARSGCYKYLDMYQAIGMGLQIAGNEK